MRWWRGRKTRQAEAETLMERAYDLLRRNNAPEALKVGLQLERRRYSGGLEIQARALRALHRPGEAMQILERGVAEVPGNWLLWQYLGSCRSDAGDFEGAFAAYESALACDHDPVSLGYNYAEALVRAGRWDDALLRLESLFAGDELVSADPQLGLYVVTLYEEALRHQGRDAEAEHLLSKYAGVLARAALAGHSLGKVSRRPVSLSRADCADRPER